MPGKWKCTVCGYVHEGAEPPALCPVCGVDRSKFIPMEQQKVNLLHDLWETFVLHPVAAHFPNGLVPTAILFLLIALVTASTNVEQTVFFLLAVVLAVAPVSMASGIYDWQTRFNGEKATIFYKKIALAATLFLLLIVAVVIRYDHPLLMAEEGVLKWTYVGLLIAMLPVVVLLGHYGAKLAHQWKKKEL